MPLAVIEPRRAQKSPGVPRRAQEEPRRAQKSPGEPTGAQQGPVGANRNRRAQDSPREPRRIAKSLAKGKVFVKNICFAL